MSKHKQDLPQDKLPLPRPRSPSALDDKILAYARQQAPQRKGSRIPGWSGGWPAGLATAGIVAIAVLITQTQQFEPSLQSRAPGAIEDRQTEEAIGNMPAAPAAPATSSLSGLAAPSRKAMKQERLADQMAEQPSAAAAQEQFADREMAADAAPAAKSAAHMGEPARMDDRQLQLRLEQCATLLQQGQAEQAREAYQALRLDCAGCELPATLDLWLAGQRQDAQP